MFAPKEVEVLVVGAGPVGMITALELDRLGIEVSVIDKDDGPATHSYACVLHPRSVQLLQHLGLADDALRRGLRIDKLALYDTTGRCAELALSALPGDTPFLLALPQSDLEESLAGELDRRGIGVQWLKRLSNLRLEEDAALGSIDELSDTGKGYAVPHLDRIVSRSKTVKAAFVVGADGRDSVVRQQAGIQQRMLPGMDCYEICEFEDSREPEDEFRIVLHESGASAFTPLPGGIGRWTMHVATEELGPEAHAKDRHHFRILNHSADGEILERTRATIRARAPWFESEIRELAWHVMIDFPSALVRRFGRGRCCLLGEAAHLTSPIGVQSMNMAFLQGQELAEIIASILRRNAQWELLDTFNSAARAQWERMLGLGEEAKLSRNAPGWAQRYKSALRTSLPASGEDLSILLRQIGIESGLLKQGDLAALTS